MERGQCDGDPLLFDLGEVTKPVGAGRQKPELRSYVWCFAPVPKTKPGDSVKARPVAQHESVSSRFWPKG